VLGRFGGGFMVSINISSWSMRAPYCSASQPTGRGHGGARAHARHDEPPKTLA
jgi:hypothetical protein